MAIAPPQFCNLYSLEIALVINARKQINGGSNTKCLIYCKKKMDDRKSRLVCLLH